MLVKNEEELEKIKEGGRLLSQLARRLSSLIRPGETGLHLDEVMRALAQEVGGQPSFLGYRGYPAALCVSINHQVVHSIPTGQPFREGDLVSVDLGLFYQGFHTDMAFTQGVGEVSEEAERLLETTRRALEAGLQTLRAGVKIREVSAAIEAEVKKGGFRVVSQLTGHGLGRELHEEPLIPNFAHPPASLGEQSLPAGLLVALEPIVTSGSGEIVTLRDGWTVETKDKALACHFETTALVGPAGTTVITPLP